MNSRLGDEKTRLGNLVTSTLTPVFWWKDERRGTEKRNENYAASLMNRVSSTSLFFFCFFFKPEAFSHARRQGTPWNETKETRVSSTWFFVFFFLLTIISRTQRRTTNEKFISDVVFCSFQSSSRGKLSSPPERGTKRENLATPPRPVKKRRRNSASNNLATLHLFHHFSTNNKKGHFVPKSLEKPENGLGVMNTLWTL